MLLKNCNADTDFFVCTKDQTNVLLPHGSAIGSVLGNMYFRTNAVDEIDRRMENKIVSDQNAQ